MNTPSPKLILIVDDNDPSATLYRDLLEAYGEQSKPRRVYSAMRVRRGKDVAEFARIRRPDLIVIDTNLPDVPGEDVIKQLKADPDIKTIPVVAIGSHTAGGAAERIRNTGCEAFLSRPVAIGLFFETIRRLLEEPSKPAPRSGSTPPPANRQ